MTVAKNQAHLSILILSLCILNIVVGFHGPHVLGPILLIPRFQPLLPACAHRNESPSSLVRACGACLTLELPVHDHHGSSAMIYSLRNKNFAFYSPPSIPQDRLRYLSRNSSHVFCRLHCQANAGLISLSANGQPCCVRAEVSTYERSFSTLKSITSHCMNEYF
jgi:hypothetical protein